MLDKLVSGALQNMMGGQNAQDPLMKIIMGLLSSKDGGLAGLLQQFQQAGLGAQAQSWVGRGPNMPVSPEQLMQVFGAGTMQQMAAGSGMDAQQLGGRLADMLPQMIDRLTPDGQVPSGGIDEALGALSKLMPR